MGGLHIEMASLKCLGDWIEGSGWLSALTSSNVVTHGRAEVVQRGSNTCEGQWIHQIMTGASYILLHKAYQVYLETVGDTQDLIMPFSEWCTSLRNDDGHPQFQYWYQTLQ